MMVHAAVYNQKLLSARFFDVDNARHVNSGFADQEPTGLNQEARAIKRRIFADFFEEAIQAEAQLREIQPRIGFEIRNAESAAKVDGSQRLTQLPRNSPRDLDRFPVLRKQH